MVWTDRARRLLPGLGWLATLFVLGCAAAGLLASMAMTDVNGKHAAVEAATAHRARISHANALVNATAADVRILREPGAFTRNADTLRHLDEAAATLAEEPRNEPLPSRIAEFVHLRREITRLAVESGLDDAHRLLDSEPVRLNRLSLSRALDALAFAADEDLALSTAALSETRQHWLSLLVGLLAAVVLLAFLQVVRLARHPAQPPADHAPILIGPQGVG